MTKGKYRFGFILQKHFRIKVSGASGFIATPSSEQLLFRYCFFFGGNLYKLFCFPRFSIIHKKKKLQTFLSCISVQFLSPFYIKELILAEHTHREDYR